MNLEDSNIKINNKTTQYTNRLETLKSQMPAILNDYNKNYILYNKDTKNEENKRLFNNINNNLVSVNSNLTILSNDVQAETNKINTELISLNSLIEEEKQEALIQLGDHYRNQLESLQDHIADLHKKHCDSDRIVSSTFFS